MFLLYGRNLCLTGKTTDNNLLWGGGGGGGGVGGGGGGGIYFYVPLRCFLYMPKTYV